MLLDQYTAAPDEKPLDRFPENGGLCSIFRTIGCIGDSLASGEFESTDEKGATGYHDFFEYSWGQYIARMTGSKVYNFSRGGMTAMEYWKTFAEQNRFWDKDKLCQAYIIALGVNDLYGLHQTVGSCADINKTDWEKSADNFAGYYGRIVCRLKSMQPQARFFFMTMPHSGDPASDATVDAQAALMREMAKFFDYSYVIDLAAYAPVYDADFKRRFFLGGHMSPLGYQFTARMTAAYIDYLIRKAPEDFAQVGFIGQPFHNLKAKW